MRIIIDVDGDMQDLQSYLDAIKIDKELIQKISFEEVKCN
jgi:hypothetical protein